MEKKFNMNIMKNRDYHEYMKNYKKPESKSPRVNNRDILSMQQIRDMIDVKIAAGNSTTTGFDPGLATATNPPIPDSAVITPGSTTADPYLAIGKEDFDDMIKQNGF